MSHITADTLDAVADEAARLSDQAGRLTHRGVDALRSASRQVRVGARHASEGTIDYIRAEPLKATLIAAAAGAVLMGLVCLIGRPRGRH